MRFLTLMATSLSWILCTDVSVAGFVLALTETGSPGSFQVEAGSTIIVPVYIVQTDGENRLATLGLFSAGVTANFDQLSGPSGLAIPQTATLASHWTDTIGNFTKIDLNARQITLEGLVTGTSSVKTSGNSNAIRIGEISFAAGNVDNVTSLRLSLVDNLPNINLLLTPPRGTPIDTSFVGGTINTITAVPEPSTLILVGLAASSMGAAAWRKRKRLLTRTQVSR
jgi:hypothetical protein